MKITNYLRLTAPCVVALMLMHAEIAWARLDTEFLQEKVSASAKDFKGHLGVGVVDIKSGESWYLNGDDRFRMMSVVKVPVVMAALRKVDEGKLQLQQEIPLTKSDVAAIRNAAIPDPLPANTKTATLSSLMERSICRSNNGAVDVLTRTLGGPSAVNAFIKNAQVAGIRVDRYEVQAAESGEKDSGTDLLDSASPRALCTLLTKLESGKLLSEKSTNYLLDLMQRCETGDHRIRAGFPKDWMIADKTGTGKQVKGVNVATNDVAIITRPDKSRLILTVFVGNAKLSRPACENKIAEVARALYDSMQEHAKGIAK